MSKLAQAVNNATVTENGAPAYKSSLRATLDLFFRIGASRGRDLSIDFGIALKEDADLALRVMLWGRDVRGGAGERQQFRNLLGHLCEIDLDIARKTLLSGKIEEVGRWDDYSVFFGTPLEKEAATRWVNAIASDNALAAKWAPRKDKKGARPLRVAAGMREREWRKYVSARTQVVEHQMCANDWDNIEYDKLPSLASARYQKAFHRHDLNGYEEYLTALQKGTAKINAGAVYPHDAVLSVKHGNEIAADAQWKALPNYLEGNNETFLPMVDVSGSMGVTISGSVTAMDVSVALGLYLSERNNSVFKNQFITFSQQPQMIEVKGDNLYDRYVNVCRSDWGINTNLEAAFDMILDAAVEYELAPEDMPSKLLVLSDMQFDDWTVKGATAFGMVREKYRAAGYEMPQLVWWNLNDRGGNIPVSYNQDGTALVSGFSPAIMKSLLAGRLNPMQVMYDAVMQDRYRI